MTELKNKTAIITGSSRGLGKKTAIEFAKKGANVVINYNSNEAEATSTVNEIISLGGRAISIQGNVSQSEDVNQLFEKTIEHFGKVDIVVNNAGIMITKFLKDFPEDEFDKQFSINVKSVFLMMKKAFDKLEENGRIINVSSSTSRLMMPSYAVYSATKAAVEQMTRIYAKEIGSKGITVNSVLPGPMNTELFLNGKSEELISRIASQSAFNRIGNVEDIIPIILFLSTEEAQWITGQNIGVNGGMA
ncbi:MAG TPA: SDR family oxidoreductase [Moheibacter sp.]|nr:SDR family oxidoreductase [Moheibacter sp.]